MRVIVDQPRNHRLAAQVDFARLAPGDFFHRGVASSRDDTLVLDCERLCDSEMIIDGDDFAVVEQEVGICRRRGRAGNEQRADRISQCC